MAAGRSRDDILARIRLLGRRAFSRDTRDSARDTDRLGRAAERAGIRSRLASAGFNLARKSVAALGTAAKLAAVGGLALLAVEGVKAFKSLARIERIGAQTDAAIKSTGGAAHVTREQIDAYAGALERSTSIEAETVTQGQNMLLTFTQIKNEVGKGNDIFDQATSTLVDMSVALGTDMRKQAIQLGKALNDPVRGITALKKVGVTFTDQQRDQIAAMVESGNVLAAQKVILRELNREFGGSGTKLAKTYEGQLRLVGHEWGTITEAIAMGAFPAIKAVTGGLRQFLQEAVDGEGAGGRFATTVEKGATLAGAAFAGVSHIVLTVVRTLRGWAQTKPGQTALTLLGQAAHAVQDGLSAIPRIIRGADSSLQEIGANPAGATLIATFGALPPVFTATSDAIGTVTDFLGDHRTAVTAVAAVIGALFIPQLVLLGAAAIASGTAQAVGWTIAQAAAIRTNVVLAVTYAAMLGGYLFAGAAAIASGIQQAAGWAIAQAGAIGARVVMAVSAAFVVAQWIGMGIAAMANAAVMAAAWFIALGPVAWVIGGLVLLGAAFLVAYKKIGWFRDGVDAVVGFIKRNWPIVVGILTGGIGFAVIKIVQHWDDLVSFVTGLPGRLADAGKGMFDWVIDAFKAPFNWIINAWNGLSFSLPEVDSHIPGVGKVGGWSLSAPDIPLLAAGGIIRNAGAVVVGDAGPELLNLPRAARVDPLPATERISTRRVVPRLTSTGRGPRFGDLDRIDLRGLLDGVIIPVELNVDGERLAKTTHRAERRKISRA